MIVAVLAVLGLILGSFVNALVWRLHETEESLSERLSIVKGRSMCPKCKHELAAKDLVPVLSWLTLRGKCRYCGAPISAQYPLVELGMAGLYVASYVWWPLELHGGQVAIFVLWLALLVGLVALLIYDMRWYLLPNRIIYPLAVVAGAYALISVVVSDSPAKAFVNLLLSVAIGGGIFYLLFQVSKGKWIGGGDVKLGWLLGLVVGTPGKAVLFIFLASVIGSAVSLPLMLGNKLKRNSVIPFGPFLIIGAVITVLFGSHILHWYQQTFIEL